MTKAQHCWVEWYSPGYGWVVVDPADVRKAILEKKITMEQAKPLREYYFGAVDESRIAIGTGRDQTAQRGPVRIQHRVHDPVPRTLTAVGGTAEAEKDPLVHRNSLR